MSQTPDDGYPSPLRGDLRSRVTRALRAMLQQGHTPEKVALSIALGIAFGLFPIFGTTTVLCIVAGMALRLNHPAIQITNQLMYPLQIPLIVVFIRVGEAVLGVAPIPFSAAMMLAELRASPGTLFERFGTASLHGIVGWATVAPAVVALTYALLLPLLRVISRRPAAAAAEGAASPHP
jgi:uncharacterized protein (DUF2062 family)